MRPLVLVLRALGLGDFATGVPALRAVRRAYPEHEIALAAPAVLRPLVEATGAVDRLVPTSAYVRGPLTRVPWRGRRPAVAVNLQGRGPQSHVALLALRPGRLLGFRCASAGFPRGPVWRDAEHEVARWCRMLDWHGVPADPGDLALPPPSPSPPRGDTRPAVARPGGVPPVVIHPGASSPERRWPVRRYAAVAEALAVAGYRVVVTGSAAEEPAARVLAAGAGLPVGAVLAGSTDLATLAALVASARLVISGDTGVAHLATGYATPSVVLFGPMSPARWGPPPDRPRHVALWHGADGLLDITPEEVLGAAGALLAPDRHRPRPARAVVPPCGRSTAGRA